MKSPNEIMANINTQEFRDHGMLLVVAVACKVNTLDVCETNSLCLWWWPYLWSLLVGTNSNDRLFIRTIVEYGVMK